jgi:hypothetical protein
MPGVSAGSGGSTLGLHDGCAVGAGQTPSA